MIVLDRNHLGLVDLVGAAQRVRPPGRVVRDRPRRRRVSTSRCGPSSSARRGSRRSGPGVEVLAEVDGRPVLAREGRFLVAAFHPELTDDTRLHELFLDLVREAAGCPGIASGRRSSTRRAPPTRSAASSSRSSRARSSSRRRRAAAIPRTTSRCRTRSRRRSRTRCRRTTSTARSRRARARTPTPTRSRRSSTRATAPRASR